MRSRRADPRHVKSGRTYSIDEAARILGVHKQTVRNWIKAGLPVMASQRPHLIAGSELKTFLIARRQRSKRPCGPGELYCLKCREPRQPAEGMLDYIPLSLVSGNLQGICPACGCLIYRRVSLAKIDAVAGRCAVAFPQSQERLGVFLEQIFAMLSLRCAVYSELRARKVELRETSAVHFA